MDCIGSDNVILGFPDAPTLPFPLILLPEWVGNNLSADNGTRNLASQRQQSCIQADSHKDGNHCRKIENQSRSIFRKKQCLDRCGICKTGWPRGDFPIGKAWLKATLELEGDIAASLCRISSFLLLNELHSICIYVSAKDGIFWSPTEAIKCTWAPKFGGFT